jgi:hypothetical protein
MNERHKGLTPEVAEYYLQAARVCLHRHHIPPVQFSITNGESKMEATTEWEAPDARVRAAWTNEIDATEAGAYACALAAVELSEGLYAIRRAETRTGADYYVGPINHDFEDLEGCLRLEVSGTDAGTSSMIEHRLREKVEQAAKGNSNLPAMAGVVGFQARLIILERVQLQ